MPSRIHSLLKRGSGPASGENADVPLEGQIEAWRKANRKMKWGIGEREFDGIEDRHQLTESESQRGFNDVVLFYGFGSDEEGGSDSVLSGKSAWDFALKTRKKGTVWQSPYVDFGRPDAFRLRPGAPARPKGFYFAKIRTAKGSRPTTVNQARRIFTGFTGWGPEGFQFLCITHTYFADLMSDRKIPFMALADYDIAPYGFNDFIDAPQLFSSNGILGLGIGNVDQQYPGFVVPTLILA